MSSGIKLASIYTHELIIISILVSKFQNWLHYRLFSGALLTRLATFGFGKKDRIGLFLGHVPPKLDQSDWSISGVSSTPALE